MDSIKFAVRLLWIVPYGYSKDGCEWSHLDSLMIALTHNSLLKRDIHRGKLHSDTINLKLKIRYYQHPQYSLTLESTAMTHNHTI